MHSSFSSAPVLLTSVGLGQYKETTYELQGARFASRFAPVALANLLSLRDGNAFVLVTSKAKANTYADIEQEFSRSGINASAVDIPDGQNIEQILSIVDQLITLIEPKQEVILDVSLSTRHLPFVFLAALMYLVGLRSIKIRGIFYGAFDMQSAEGVTPIIDISSLFILMEWYQALSIAHRTGSFGALSLCLDEALKSLFVQGISANQLSKIKKDLQSLAQLIAVGLPLEVGCCGSRLRENLRVMTSNSSRTNALTMAVQSLEVHLSEWSLPLPVKNKNEVGLTADELRRQLRLIRWYAKLGDAPRAIILSTEWLTSLVLLSWGETASWLDYNLARYDAADFLNDLARAAQSEKNHGAITADQFRILAPWNKLKSRRNDYAHAGMSEHWIRPDTSFLSDILNNCHDLIEKQPRLTRPKGRSDLVTGT